MSFSHFLEAECLWASVKPVPTCSFLSMSYPSLSRDCLTAGSNSLLTTLRSKCKTREHVKKWGIHIYSGLQPGRHAALCSKQFRISTQHCLCQIYVYVRSTHHKHKDVANRLFSYIYYSLHCCL